jgi:hypothetical protein
VERAYNAALKQSKIRLDFVRASIAAYILAAATAVGGGDQLFLLSASNAATNFVASFT